MNNLCRGRRCYIPNIKALGLLVSEMKIFKDFAFFYLLVAMATRLMAGIQSLEELWLSFTQGTSLPSFIKIGPVV